MKALECLVETESLQPLDSDDMGLGVRRRWSDEFGLDICRCCNDVLGLGFCRRWSNELGVEAIMYWTLIMGLGVCRRWNDEFSLESCRRGMVMTWDLEFADVCVIFVSLDWELAGVCVMIWDWEFAVV